MTTQTNIGYADTKIKNSLASIRSNEFVCVHLFHRMSAVVWHSSMYCTFLNQQRGPLPSLLSDSYSMNHSYPIATVPVLAF